MGQDERLKLQSHPQRDMSNIQCYYCGENGHVQVRCKQMKENLKKLRDMNKDGANSQANVIKSVEDEDDVLDTLKIDGEFSHFKLGNGEKMKVEGIGSVRMKLCDNAIRIFSNVRFVPSVVVNMISIGR